MRLPSNEEKPVPSMEGKQEPIQRKPQTRTGRKVGNGRSQSGQDGNTELQRKETKGKIEQERYTFCFLKFSILLCKRTVAFCFI